MSKILSKDLTSHDLLKTLALVTMVIDHLGYFFYPEERWFRVIGRVSAPIWFYLIGYADTRKVQPAIWVGGVLVILSRIITSQYLFPIDILFALGVCRLAIDEIMKRALRNHEAFWGMFLLLFFLTLPSFMLIEYGTLGPMFCMIGFMRRHKDEIKISLPLLSAFIAACFFSYFIMHLLMLPFMNPWQLAVFAAEMVILALLLFFFTPGTWPRLTRLAGPVIAPVVRLTGRRTLELYVIHLYVFTALALVIRPDRFRLGMPDLLPVPLMNFLGIH